MTNSSRVTDRRSQVDIFLVVSGEEFVTIETGEEFAAIEVFELSGEEIADSRSMHFKHGGINSS